MITYQREVTLVFNSGAILKAKLAEDSIPDVQNILEQHLGTISEIKTRIDNPEDSLTQMPFVYGASFSVLSDGRVVFVKVSSLDALIIGNREVKDIM